MTYTAKDLETKLRLMAQPRVSKKNLGKQEYQNDAGYWDGGRCNWGASHNLQEDCQCLASFFSGITELKNARKELITFNNQQEFEKKKENFLNKAEKAISGLQMKTSNNTSIGGICIVWNDFADKLNVIVENFRRDLELLKQNIERIPYNEWKELQKLLSDERKLQKEIEENERKARNEPDENKKKQFIFLADQAKDKWKRILSRKKELKSANLGDNFNPDIHIDNFLQAVEDKLTGKNRPTRPTNRPRQSNSNSFNQTNAENDNSSPLTPNQLSKNFLQRYWKELLLLSGFLIGVYYIINQPDE